MKPLSIECPNLTCIINQSWPGWYIYIYIYCAPGPLTALPSSPGAGNTWARYLIQQFTVFVTGAIYNDKALRKSDFPGEKFFDGRVTVIKTHETT